ncbi:MAG: porin family protein [Sandaracinus sp.]
MRLIGEGQVDEGITELEEAYRILPHPNVLFNIARAQVEAGRYEQALDYYERYLESDPQDRESVETQMADLRTRIQSQRVAAPVVEDTGGGETSGGETTGPVASEDELSALEDSASQIDMLGQAASSEELRARAERLRALARSLRERRAQEAAQASTGTGTGTGTETGTGSETGTGTETGTETGTGTETQGPAVEVREGDTYEESVVSSARAAQSPLDAPNSTTIVTAQDIRLSGITDPAFALRRVAGVSLLQTDPGNPQLNIRGLNQRLSNRVVVLIDGRSVYLDFLGTTLWNFLPLNSEDIERIEVIRGPASALYGADAFSGIVNIITRNPGDAGNYVSAGVGTGGQFRLTAGASARVDRFRFRLSGGYQRADQYALEVGPSRVDASPAATDPNLGYDRLQFNGDAVARVDRGVTLRFGGGLSTGSFAFQGLSRLRQLHGQNGFFSQAFVQMDTDIGLSARVFWNRFATTVTNQASIPGGLELSQTTDVRRQDIVDAEVVYRNSFDLAGIDNAVIAGIGYRFKEIDWDWISGLVQTQHHGSLFLQDTLRFSDVLQIVLSVRGDLHPLVGPQVSPRGSVVVHPTEGQTIRLTGGAAFRSPTFVESYVSVPNQTPLRGATAFGVGSTSLNPERMISVELGYMNAMTEYFSLELNGYFNFVYDFIFLSNNQAFRLADFTNGTPRAGYDPTNQAYTVGQLFFANEPGIFRQIGGELGARAYPVDGLDIYANYAIHETAPLAGGAANSPFARDARTSAHMINAGVQYRAPFGLHVAVDFSWQSQQTWVEQELDPNTNQVVFTTFALPDYATLNARVGWSLFDDHLDLAIVGTNLVADGHREHPFGQPIDRRFLGTATVRF